jgi:hypothetical protein
MHLIIAVITDMIRHNRLNPDKKLTRFLQVPGAPIHNNDMERGLKIPIRGRNTWLFYKTEYGALVGGVLTSIIYTCELSGINPCRKFRVLC